MSERRVFDANERIPLALTAQQINVLIFLCRKARCADLCLDDILPVLHELETQPHAARPQPSVAQAIMENGIAGPVEVTQPAKRTGRVNP